LGPGGRRAGGKWRGAWVPTFRVQREEEILLGKKKKKNCRRDRNPEDTRGRGAVAWFLTRRGEKRKSGRLEKNMKRKLRKTEKPMVAAVFRRGGCFGTCTRCGAQSGGEQGKPWITPKGGSKLASAQLAKKGVGTEKLKVAIGIPRGKERKNPWGVLTKLRGRK